MDNLKKEIGDRLKKFRKLLNKTQTELSNEISISLPNISRTESGVLYPNTEMLFKLNTKYNLNINWIISGKGIIRPAKLENTQDFGEWQDDFNEMIFMMNSIPFIRYGMLKYYFKYKEQHSNDIRKRLEEQNVTNNKNLYMENKDEHLNKNE
jgi:transcriptional regulator with XRE-family HTH domain